MAILLNLVKSTFGLQFISGSFASRARGIFPTTISYTGLSTESALNQPAKYGVSTIIFTTDAVNVSPVIMTQVLVSPVKLSSEHMLPRMIPPEQPVSLKTLTFPTISRNMADLVAQITCPRISMIC